MRYGASRSLTTDTLDDIVQYFVNDEDFHDEEWYRVRNASEVGTG